MATFDLNEIKSQAKDNFTEAWVSTAKLIPSNTKVALDKKGKPHLLRELIQKSREILLNLGFDEAENFSILSDSDVVKQYGSEARVILDRAFYLATLPRPEIGLSTKKIAMAKKIAGEFDTEKLQTILREYKKGDIEADDLIEELITGLGITDYQATELLDKVFADLKELKPLPSALTTVHRTGHLRLLLRKCRMRRITARILTCLLLRLMETTCLSVLSGWTRKTNTAISSQ